MLINTPKVQVIRGSTIRQWFFYGLLYLDKGRNMDIPYKKIFIYMLTFFAYAYTGIGSSMLRNLKDAVLSAESVFGDIFRNAITVAEKFRSLHEVFDAAVEEDCIYKCPGGN